MKNEHSPPLVRKSRKAPGTKKKRKKKGRVIIGICAICLLIRCAVRNWDTSGPYYSFIHNIFVPQTIPAALQEYEEADTLKKTFEKGWLTGYEIRIENIEKEGWPGTFTEEHFFDLSGNLVEIKCYDEENDALWYIEEYDVSGISKTI